MLPSAYTCVSHKFSRGWVTVVSAGICRGCIRWEMGSRTNLSFALPGCCGALWSLLQTPPQPKSS